MTATPATVWTVEKMKARLARDPKAVERALLVLWYNQTASEQATQSTVEDNGVGFNGLDAQILSSFAEQISQNRGHYPDGRRLSPKQMKLAIRKIGKYAAQLLRLAGIRRVKPKKEDKGPILQWDRQKMVTERSQSAWSDGWSVTIPILRAASTEEIAAEVAIHNQSSYGALRWRTYRMVERLTMDVLVEVTEHLCD